MSEKTNRILIVDDALLIIQRVRAMLKEQDIPAEVVGAGTCAEALSALSGHDLSIAILDINLPDGNGIDILRHIKKHYPTVQVMMMSNQSGEFYRSRCHSLGAACFIDKSTEFDLLPFLISSFL